MHQQEQDGEDGEDEEDGEDGEGEERELVPPLYSPDVTPMGSDRPGRRAGADATTE